MNNLDQVFVFIDEPDHVIDGDEDCVAMFISNAKWTDRPCGQLHPGICEKSSQWGKQFPNIIYFLQEWNQWSCNSYQLIINSKLEFMFPLFAVTGTSDSETKSNEIQKSIGISFFWFC